ncbi:MAG: ATP-grasp domain-containing protein, partial [Promethearchaeota archaeon]
DRFEAFLLIKNAGLLYPKWYYGTPQTIKKNIKDKDYPLILKPVSGSGSRGVKVIYNFSDIENLNQDILYLEKYIEGTHYTVYFIGDKICAMEKIPLKNEHSEMTRRELSKEIKQIIMKWKNQYNLLFGHLDIVVEKKTHKHLVVDPGSFPEFSNWKCGGDPVSLIGNLILEEYKKLRKK